MRRLLAITALCLLAAAPAAPAATRHIVRGAGFGHGIGMSQYGAYGYAQQGFDYQRILRHYYTGTQLGTAPSRPVRVLLQASDPYVRFTGATKVAGRRVNPDTVRVVRPARGGRLRVSGVGTFTGPLQATGGGSIRLLGPAINGVSSGRYRGTMVLHAGAAGGVTAINSLPIDSYVQGVVAGEMPSSWHPEALKAQAVTARTYALSTRKSGEVFDLYPDTRSQVYLGVQGERSTTNSAIRATSNEVVTYGGDIATTFFFSTSGGRTENIENSFVGSTPRPWLKSVPDPYDDISPKHRWRFRFTTGQLGAKLGSSGTFRKVTVLRRGNSPRIVRARVYGSRGTRDLTGPQIRARLGLYDTWAFFTKVSTSQVRRPSRASASVVPLPQIKGAVSPAPRSRRLVVQRRTRKGWRPAGRVRTDRRGRFSTAVSKAGVYRVKSGPVAGPAIRVR
ncbi:MAG: SpoIID/LytB domain-containing protein [Actinomycetota bacterium]